MTSYPTVNFDLQALDQALQEQVSIQNIDPFQVNFHHPALTGFPECEFPECEFPELKVHLFETVSSTNTVAWELLQQGAGSGTVTIALMQQAGRGQWGHQWSSAKGGLYLSLGLILDLPVAQAGVLTLSSAWGIAVALHGCGIPVGIKWLNDLVFAGCKLGGILTETRITAGHIHQAVIGVGINWSNPVPEIGVNLQTIQMDGSKKPIDSLEKLAAIVLQGLRLGYCYWQQQGIQSLVAAYETLLVNIGDEVTIDGVSEEVFGEVSRKIPGKASGKASGKIVGITPTGQLRVQMSSPDPIEIYLEPGAIHLGYR